MMLPDYPPIQADPDRPVAPWASDFARTPGHCEHRGSPCWRLWKHPRCAFSIRACRRDHAIAAVAGDAWWIALVTAHRRRMEELRASNGEVLSGWRFGKPAYGPDPTLANPKTTRIWLNPIGGGGLNHSGETYLGDIRSAPT